MATDYKTGLKSNIWKYYLFEALWSLVFFFPIFQLFYLARSLTIFQIALIGIGFSITTLIFEVPSGVLADKWGRKKTLFLSQTFFIISMLIIIFGSHFWHFFIAAIFTGLWWACYSGTGVAFFYDTLIELKRRKEYEKLMGRLNLFTGIVGFIAAFSAGFLFNIDIRLPYIFSAAFSLLSLIVITKLTEPKFHKHAEEETFFSHFKSSIKQVAKTEYLVFIVIFGAVLGWVLDFIFSYSQIYFKLISIPVVLFGIIFAFESLIEGIGGWSADKIKNTFSYRSIFSSSLLFTLLAVFLMSYLKNYLGVIIFLLVMFINGMFRIIKRGYVHNRVKSYNRATIDSISTFGMWILIIIFEPIAGKIADIYSIQTSFFILGCILLIYTIYYFVTKFNHKKLFSKYQSP